MTLLADVDITAYNEPRKHSFHLPGSKRGLGSHPQNLAVSLRSPKQEQHGHILCVAITCTDENILSSPQQEKLTPHFEFSHHAAWILSSIRLNVKYHILRIGNREEIWKHQ